MEAAGASSWLGGGKAAHKGHLQLAVSHAVTGGKGYKAKTVYRLVVGYSVEASGETEQVVYKRWSEFEALHQELSEELAEQSMKLSKHIVVPHKRTLTMGDPQRIEGRRVQLQQYCDWLLEWSQSSSGCGIDDLAQKRTLQKFVSEGVETEARETAREGGARAKSMVVPGALAAGPWGGAAGLEAKGKAQRNRDASSQFLDD